MIYMSKANRDNWTDIFGKRREGENILTAQGPAVGNILQHNMQHSLDQRIVFRGITSLQHFELLLTET